MDFDQLRQFDEIVRRGSISSAARALHITQPALSRSMQRLETDLGHQVFTRMKNRVEPNEAGMLVVDFARAMLREERVLRDSLDGLSLRSRSLRIGSVSPSPLWRLTELTVERFPGTVLQPLTRSEEELAADLENRTVDLAITLEPLAVEGCVSVAFMEEALCAYVSKDHPLAGKGAVELSRFDGESFLVDPHAGFWLDLIRKKAPHIKFVEQEDRLILVQMVRSTQLPTFLTRATMMYATDKDRALVPLSDSELNVTFYLNALDSAPAQVADIMDHVRQVART